MSILSWSQGGLDKSHCIIILLGCAVNGDMKDDL
jgi:hypothetical protein